jgi:hypothetical protein
MFTSTMVAVAGRQRLILGSEQLQNLAGALSQFGEIPVGLCANIKK